MPWIFALTSAKLLSMNFKGADILSSKQFNRGDIEAVLKMAGKALPYASKKKFGDLLKGKLLATLFYEPSTRTRLSFETAMIRLGGSVVSSVGVQGSSVAKGETLYDTGKMISTYVDVIAIRHNEDNSADEMAHGSSVPVINAGDGCREHPTQALLDLFTIQQELGKVDGLKVAMVGDLKYGRTVHSLSEMLSHFNVKLTFVSPPELKMPEGVCRFLKEKNVPFAETAEFADSIKDADVVYMTRIQQERFAKKKDYEKHRNVYVLTSELIKEKNPKMLILHPLPRVWEITKDVDELPGAAYFRQAKSGLAVRMALLMMVLGKSF